MLHLHLSSKLLTSLCNVATHINFYINYLHHNMTQKVDLLLMTVVPFGMSSGYPLYDIPQEMHRETIPSKLS